MTGKQLALAIAAYFGVTQVARLRVTGKYRSLYEAAGQNYGVDPDVLHAIALQETRENPAAISPPNVNGTRDYGLMQINSSNLQRFGLDETSALDPEQSVNAAAQLVAEIHAQLGSTSILDTFSIYNAGSHNGAARITDAGAYRDESYVASAMTWYLLVLVASLAVVKNPQWE